MATAHPEKPTLVDPLVAGSSGGNETPTHEDSAEEATGNESPAHEDPTEEVKGEYEQIRHYLKKGYTFDYLVGKLHFNKSSVRDVIDRENPPEVKRGKTTIGDSFPLMRKTGGGGEIATPEALLREYTDGGRDDQLELRGMMKFRAAMLAIMDLVSIQKGIAEADAIRLRPILELMKETRVEQDAAAARAKESNIEIAERAAYEGARRLAEQVVPEVRTLMEKQKPAPGGLTMHERMFGPIADMMGKQIGNIFSGMFGGGQSQPGQQSPSSQFGQMTEEEREAIFGGSK